MSVRSFAASPASLSLPGDWVPQPSGVTVGSANRSFTTGRAFLVRYVPTKARTITLAAIACVTAATTTTDPLEVAVYTAGATLTQVATTGQRTNMLGSPGVKTAPLALTVSPDTTYYVAIAGATVGGTSAVIQGSTVQSPDGWLLWGTTQPLALAGVLDGALVGGLLPATISAAAVGWGTLGTMPGVALRES